MTLNDAIRFMDRAIANRRLAQAFILEGNPREEAGALANAILRRLFCTSEKPPCGACVACLQTERARHPDILLVEPQKKSRLISVEQIREVSHRIFETSFAGGWKACVIAGADRLGSAASNALLKTLEEPPPRCLFLLLTDAPQSLLTTIASRCQRIRLTAPPPPLPQEWTQRLGTILCLRSESQTGLLHPLGQADAMIELLKDIKSGVEEEIVTETKSMDALESKADKDTLQARISARFREERARIMQAVVLWYRDQLLLVCDGSRDALHHKHEVEQLEQECRGLSLRQALQQVAVAEQMNRDLESNLNENTVFPAAFLHLMKLAV